MNGIQGLTSYIFAPKVRHKTCIKLGQMRELRGVEGSFGDQKSKNSHGFIVKLGKQ